jgi:hypothetical protein
MCTCQKDQDGRCLDCSAGMVEAFTRYVHSNMRFARDLGDLCIDCRKTMVDWAMAKVLRDLVEEDPSKETVNFASGVIGGFLQSSGIKYTPLLEAELKKFMIMRAQREDHGGSSETSG